MGFKTVFVGLILTIFTVPFGDDVLKLENHGCIRTELEYYKQAAKLNDLLFSKGTPVNMDVLVSVLKEIDVNVAKYFPNGPFTRTDFIAMGWLESEFRQFEVGTHGERGIFQIMPNHFVNYKITKNYYAVDVNTRMAFRVLGHKYEKWHDYKTAIMAYNGLVKFKNGRYSQQYFSTFNKRKVEVELALSK